MLDNLKFIYNKTKNKRKKFVKTQKKIPFSIIIKFYQFTFITRPKHKQQQQQHQQKLIINFFIVKASLSPKYFHHHLFIIMRRPTTKHHTHTHKKQFIFFKLNKNVYGIKSNVPFSPVSHPYNTCFKIIYYILI